MPLTTELHLQDHPRRSRGSAAGFKRCSAKNNVRLETPQDRCTVGTVGNGGRTCKIIHIIYVVCVLLFFPHVCCCYICCVNIYLLTVPMNHFKFKTLVSEENACIINIRSMNVV